MRKTLENRILGIYLGLKRSNLKQFSFQKTLKLIPQNQPNLFISHRAGTDRSFLTKTRRPLFPRGTNPGATHIPKIFAERRSTLVMRGSSKFNLDLSLWKSCLSFRQGNGLRMVFQVNGGWPRYWPQRYSSLLWGKDTQLWCNPLDWRWTRVSFF